MDITARKQFPEGFPSDVINIVKNMSFTDGKNIKIVGSMSLRSQLYAGDYDTIEIVETNGGRESALTDLVRKFKQIVKDVQRIPYTYISDIKSGSVEEWAIIFDPYDQKKSLERLETLYSQHIIDKEIYENGKKQIKPKVSKYEHLILQRDFRPNIIRWKPRDILLGYKTLIDGRKFTLKEAFQTPVITKLDVISWVQNNRFTDFSTIYQFNHNGRLLNAGIRDIAEAIKENILILQTEGNYFKMAKRMFSLARYNGYEEYLPILSQLFNGDIGIIYMVYGDIGTLEGLFDEPSIPYSRLHFEVDQFKARLSNVKLRKYLSKEKHIFGVIDEIIGAHSRDHALKLLTIIKNELYEIMNHYAKLYLAKYKLI
jgi:hypothetical protein